MLTERDMRIIRDNCFYEAMRSRAVKDRRIDNNGQRLKMEAADAQRREAYNAYLDGLLAETDDAELERWM